MIDNLIEQLKRRYPRVITEKQGNYVLIVLTLGDKEYILCLNNIASEYLYGKFTSLDETHLLDCKEIELSPYGLYLFAKTPEEFIEKIPVKLTKLWFIKSRVH